MAKTKEKPATANQTNEVFQNNLEVAAYYHWINRGCPENDSLTDWVEVEKDQAVKSHSN
jgi:hypothetical protein